MDDISFGMEMKSPTYLHARDANDFFETVILLYDRRFFHARTRTRTSVFNPAGRAYRKEGGGGNSGDEELTQSMVSGMDGIFWNPALSRRSLKYHFPQLQK